MPMAATTQVALTTSCRLYKTPVLTTRDFILPSRLLVLSPKVACTTLWCSEARWARSGETASPSGIQASPQVQVSISFTLYREVQEEDLFLEGGADTELIRRFSKKHEEICVRNSAIQPTSTCPIHLFVESLDFVITICEVLHLRLQPFRRSSQSFAVHCSAWRVWSRRCRHTQFHENSAES